MLVPFEFGQHAPVFSHLSAVFRQNTRGERGNGGVGRGWQKGATTRSLFSHPADGCMVSRLGVASRHKKVSWLLDLPLQRLGRNHAFSHSLGYSGESGAGSESILSTAESRGRTARVYSLYSGESGRTARVYSLSKTQVIRHRHKIIYVYGYKHDRAWSLIGWLTVMC